MIRSIVAMPKKLRAIVCFLLLTQVGGSAVKAQEAADKNQPTSFWMQKKLENSKEILAGITTADFDKVVQNAQSMRRLSSIEGFIRGRTPGYRTQLQIFEDSADEIIRQGQKTMWTAPRSPLPNSRSVA